MNELEVFNDSQINDIKRYLSNIDMIPHKTEIQAEINAKAAEIKQSIIDIEDKKNCQSVQKTAKQAIEDTEAGRVAISNAFRQVGNDFKHEVDDMLKPITDIIDDMKAQVKSINIINKNDKRLRIYHQIIEPMYTSRGLDPHKAVINDKWLNSSTSHNQILKDVANYADIALAEAKRNGSVVNSHGMIINSYGEPTNIKARKAIITYYGDAESLENKLKELDKNVNVIDVDFE